jgi:hypothetical protein
MRSARGTGTARATSGDARRVASARAAAASRRTGSPSTICTVNRPASCRSSATAELRVPKPSAAARTVRNSMIAMTQVIAVKPPA